MEFWTVVVSACLIHSVLEKEQGVKELMPLNRQRPLMAQQHRKVARLEKSLFTVV